MGVIEILNNQISQQCILTFKIAINEMRKTVNLLIRLSKDNRLKLDNNFVNILDNYNNTLSDLITYGDSLAPENLIKEKVQN